MRQKIKDKVSELFKATPKEIGVGFGKKIKNGKLTGETCFIFMVEKKKPLNKLKKNEILPNFIKVDGKIYKTDVIETGKVMPLDLCYPSIPGNCPDCDSATAVPCFQTWCYDDYNPYHPTLSHTKPIANQNRQDYLIGGIQITSENHWLPGYHTVGTLGTIAVDNSTGALVGVTNNHVVVGDAFFTSERLTEALLNEKSDKVYQPVGGNEAYVFGRVIKYIPLSVANINYVDAAVVSVTEESIDLLNSYKQFGLSYEDPMMFATSEEIDYLTDEESPYFNSLLYSSGRTTGAKEGALCGLTAISVDSQTIVGPYDDDGTGRSAQFVNLIHFKRADVQCPYPIAPGDSGSILIADYDGVWKIIGLCFAGDATTGDGFACRIDEVANRLDISAWDGTPHPYFDNTSIEIITEEGGSPDVTKECDGNTYWQIGFGNDNAPC